ncbi:MAG: LPS export ABC transporter permease LptG [Hyphomicrobiaceae bacterium]|nr:LPS export ABC transporter permease LptG [Hyphomicrobiaceae bacterium]
MLGPRTLRWYIGKRFLVMILGAFSICCALIYMIDMVELLRMSRRAQDLSFAGLLWIGLLRMPAFTELVLAFAVMVGSISALLSLNRRSELIVMRAGGMSVWQFIGPGVIVVFLLGVAAVTLYNPLAAYARAESERLIAIHFGQEASLLSASGSDAWLRQDGADGQSVVTAAHSANQGLTLSGVIFFQFDKSGHFLERIDAERATLGVGTWDLVNATISKPGQEPVRQANYTVSTYLTREKVSDALGSEIAISFWQLPDLIQLAERTGLSAARYKMHYATLLSRPALLLSMVVLAATVSLRSFRSGGIQTMVLSGMVGGIGFFLLTEVSRQVGLAGLVAPATAVWMPICLALCVSLTVLLHQEDG